MKQKLFQSFNHDLLIALQMRAIRYLRLRPFLRDLKDPARAQERLLARILKKNRRSGFGLHHGFSKLLLEWKNGRESLGALFRRSVPVSDYESLRGWIEATEWSGMPGLTRKRPIHYAQTSGTTDRPKLIPVSAEGLSFQKRGLQIFACAQYEAYPSAFAGWILAITGPACEGTLPSGTAFGSTSGMIYRDMPSSFRRKYLIPAGVFSLADHELKYRLILRLALQTREISSIGIPNPSTLLLLLSMLDRELPSILREMERGELSLEEQLPESLRIHVRHLKTPSPDRSREIWQLLASSKERRLSLADIWPRLKVVATWTGGNCAPVLKSLENRLGPEVAIVELGYLASECRGSITVDPVRNRSVLAVDSVYYEFVERSLYEKGAMQFESVSTIETGKDYYVFITTPDGLYRYDMNDILRMTGKVANTPTVTFIQKGKGTTNITGEKLYEWQTIEAIRRTAREMQVETYFFLGLADTANGRYDFYIEFSETPSLARSPFTLDRFAKRLDAHLKSMNIEYLSKRDSKRLHPPVVYSLRRYTHEAYRKFHVGLHRGDWQFKVLSLGYAEEEPFDFSKSTLDCSNRIREAVHVS